MGKTPLSKYDVLYPEKNLLCSLRDLTEGNLSGDPIIRRCLVVEIDQVGGQLEQSPMNPKNSIRGRIISEPSPHTCLKNADLPVFWPLFPFDVFPVKEGEHVYVLFDAPDHGLWLSRIPEPFEVDDKNFTLGLEKYKINDSGITEKQVQNLSSSPEPLDTSAEFQKENVPKFTARVGDRALEGSNNTLIVLGRDRVDSVDSGEKEKAGTIDLVAGRSDKENLNMEADKSRVYITMNSDVDGNFDIKVGESAGASAAIVVKSDEVRIVARNGMKIVVEGGDITIDANTIFLGDGASDAVAQVNKVKAEIDAMKNTFNLHTHLVATAGTAVAQTGNAAPTLSQMSPTQELGSKTVKVKD